jgi:filamentous hemagglutinin family protein
MKQTTHTTFFLLVALHWWVSDYSALNYSAQAQIVPDASLSQNSVVIINANIINITGGTRVANNLFHSFSDFSVAATNTAFFNNAIDIQNILARVTGSSISQINGILRTNGAANLYLINPNGIIFGAGARLDIRGSFIASTANSINFTDGFQFSAVNPQPSALLTMSAPLGLQMGLTPQPITVLGNGDGIRTTSNLIDTTVGLRVDSLKTLALVGGDIAIAGGTLKTAGGNIELSSLGSFGQVQLNSTNQGIRLSYGTTTFQDIRLSDKASVDASGLGSGNIQVRGRNISLTGGSQIQSSALGNQNGGTISIKASGTLELTGTSPDLRFASGLVSEIRPNATGNGGDLIVEAAKLFMKDGAAISANNLGNGTGGDLSIKTSENIEAINSFITATLRISANGQGGNVTVETAKLSLQGSQISADVQGKGNGGSITIRASESVEAIGSVPNGNALSGFVISVGRSGEGKAGDIFINTSKLSLQNGAGISSSTFGKGDAGSIFVTASNSVEISGRTTNGDRPSSLAARVEDTSQGKGGNITVVSDRLVVDNGATISASDTAGVKGAGNIQISANFMRLDRDSSVDASTRSGAEGNIFLNTSNLQLFNNSRIQANAFGFATGGNIKIVTDTLVAFGNSDITANAQQASGGRITISAVGIFGTAFRNQLTSKSDITASSELGTGFNGVVQLNIAEADPSRGLSRIPIKIDDSSRLIVQRCQADVNQSKFIITGKGGVPSSPNEVITDSKPYDILGESELIISNSQTFAPQSEKKLELVEANNWIIMPDGGITLIANDPNTSLTSTNINSLKSCRN